MRVRVLKNFAAGGRTFRAGEVVEISPMKADALLSQGLVMQDKSLDGGKEAKKIIGKNTRGGKRWL